MAALAGVISWVAVLAEASDAQAQRLLPVDRVELQAGLLRTVQDLAIDRVVPHCLSECRRTGKLAYFRLAADDVEGEWRSSMPSDDSDVYKVLEGIAESLAIRPTSELRSTARQIVESIARAQRSDGYLYLWRQIAGHDTDVWWYSAARYENLASGHELYNAGHLYEAAVALNRLAGEPELLEVAKRHADHLVREFGEGARDGAPGHPEVELALVRLAKETGNVEYAKLAKSFVDRRGGQFDESLQGHAPPRLQREAVGHAVRALYLYRGMLGIQSYFGSEEYQPALDSIWSDIVERKLYLTGAMGSREQGESFGAPYELPNDDAYAETCAAVAGVLLNHELYLMEGDVRFADLLERTLFNAVLSGVGLTGRTFSYRNPLVYEPEAYGAQRQAWFDCPCCPTNLARLLPGVAKYAYAKDAAALYVLLPADSVAEASLASGSLRVRQRTDYPWSGKTEIEIEEAPRDDVDIKVRVPGWVSDSPLPSGLYRYVNGDSPALTVELNDRPLPVEPDSDGYLTIRRRWNAGDRVHVDLDMRARIVMSHPKVSANAKCVAVERGPIVYAFEAVDNQALEGIRIAPNVPFALTTDQKLPGIATLSQRRTDGNRIVAVPFFARANRGPSALRTWLPVDADAWSPP